MPLDEENKKGIIEIVKGVLSNPNTVFIVPIGMMLLSLYYFGFKITTLQDAVFICAAVFVSVISYFFTFTGKKQKEGDENLNKTIDSKLDDVLSVIRLLERDIHLMEQTGILGIAKSKENVKLLFNYRTQMYLFKLERVYLAAYVDLGPFNEDNNTSADIVNSHLEKLNTKFKLELDYYLTDLNRILSDMRDLDEPTKTSIKNESENAFDLLIETLKDIKHNEKIEQVMQITAILGNKLTKTLLNALEEWNKTPVVF